MPSVTGLEGVIAAETEIGYVNGTEGKLVYRGFPAGELALSRSYEEVAYLLWNGRLPNEAELEELKEKMVGCRRLTQDLRGVLDAMPAVVPLMNAMSAAVQALSNGENAWPPNVEQAIRITSILPVITAYRYRRSTGQAWNEDTGESGHVAHYLRLLFGSRVTEAQIKAMNAYLILAMEHGLNASTFTARVVASTESDLFSAVSAAIGAMKGPLHGGAPSGVIELLEEIGKKENTERVLREKLDRGERLMGFGHRIYKTRDPRAAALGKVAAALAGEDEWMELAQYVEREAVRLLAEVKPGRNLHANVEFYAAAVMRAIEMPSELFTPTFSASRAAGWTAHVLEQAPHNRIFRPQSQYVGPMPR